jgi:hypothetical protein
MHEFYEIYDIKRKYEVSGLKRLIPITVPMIKEFYSEGPEMNYAELSSVKNYFGEKIGFYFAWMTFYTSCLLIPGVLGIAISIY